MLAACWTLYGIAGVVVLLRVYTQLKITRQFGIGDSVMILALVSCHFHRKDKLTVQVVWIYPCDVFNIIPSFWPRKAFLLSR